MLVFKDILTEEDLFSDAYPMELVDGLYYKVTGATAALSGDIDEALIGGNASQEQSDEGVDANVVTGVNIVIYNQLKEIPGLDKKSYMELFKDWAKNLVKYYTDNKPDEVDNIKERLTELRKKVSKLWKEEEFQVFQGPKESMEGMIFLLGYDDNTPYLIFFRDGMLEEKQ